MPATPTESKPQSSKRRSKAAAIAEAKLKYTHEEQMRLGSILVTGELNAKMAKNDRRRAAAGQEPLMQFVLPEDFFSRPRMFGYKLDKDKWLQYARNDRVARGESEDEVNKINTTTLSTGTLFLLRRRSGIKYLAIEWCFPEACSETNAEKSTPRPSSDDTAADGSSQLSSGSSSSVPVVSTRPSEDSSSDDDGAFPILMLFMVARYKKLCKRPTQKQVDIISRALEYEPEWYVDAEEFDL